MRILAVRVSTRLRLAEVMGVSRRAIEHWEYGRHPIPLYAEKMLKCLMVAQLAEKRLGIRLKEGGNAPLRYLYHIFNYMIFWTILANGK
jgi:DNA-binding XRE family transcriptional regulator